LGQVAYLFSPSDLEQCKSQPSIGVPEFRDPSLSSSIFRSFRVVYSLAPTPSPWSWPPLSSKLPVRVLHPRLESNLPCRHNSVLLREPSAATAAHPFMAASSSRLPPGLVHHSDSPPLPRSNTTPAALKPQAVSLMMRSAIRPMPKPCFSARHGHRRWPPSNL
jgi:hypothetical protein